MPHTHSLDGKVTQFDDATCPICHPVQEQQKPQEKEFLPRAYRKANTVVLKLSKVSLVTSNYYEAEKCFLFTVSRMKRDGAGNVVRDSKTTLPLWDKVTLRLGIAVYKEWLNLLAILISDTQNTAQAPKRD
jgi:hypothetical protein